VLFVYVRTGKKIRFVRRHRRGGMCCFSIWASKAIFANFFSNGIGASAVATVAIPLEK